MQKLNFLARKYLKKKNSRLSPFLLLTASLVMLSACGSGPDVPKEAPTSGTPASTAGTTPATTGNTAAAVQLLVGSPQIPSSGTTTVDLTAVVLNANKQTLAGRTVTFSPGTDATAYITNASGSSDVNGVATAKLNIGTNRANRTINVSAAVDTVTATRVVDVIGTTIAVGGNRSLSLGSSTTFTYTLKDSTGTAVQGMALNLASQTGNGIVMTPATGITNNSGQVSAVITASKAGNDVITASAAGASATHALAVSSDSFTFTSPTVLDLPLAPPTLVTVTWSDGGVPQVGKQVFFSSSRGTVLGSPATTDSSGSASVTVSSPLSSGPAVITATGPGSTPSASLNVALTATTAKLVTVQAIPNVIQVTSTSASQTGNVSTITAIVRDASENVVKNAGVNFSIISDPSGGSLSATKLVTDAFGSASVTYTAGKLSSPQNGVTISVTVIDVNGALPTTAVAGTTSLTVAGPSLFVRLGTNNGFQSSSSSSLLYAMEYVSIVTDSGGRPVPGADVRFQLRPGHFRKGTYTRAIYNLDGEIVTPGKLYKGAECDNEDINFSGVFTSSKDTNQNGQLDPGGIASVSPTATTDANGVAKATITYPVSHAIWSEVTLEARTGVAGDDPPARATFYLPGIVDAIYGLTAAPDLTGIAVSPYGINAVCTDTK